MLAVLYGCYCGSTDGLRRDRELFRKAILKAVKLNIKYVPPYGEGASLYIRPLLIGTGAQVGVKPAKEYMFMVFVGPVGPYFKEGFSPCDFMVTEEYDRAAPLGTGHIKVGGNYRIGIIIRKNIVWFVRFGNRSNFYKYFP